MNQTDRRPLASVERKGPTEDADVEEIVRCILIAQAQNAGLDHRPIGRGTHTKGICARAEFEVLDIRNTVGDATLADRLARGLFARPGTYQATVRFANAVGRKLEDSKADVRALSFFVEVPPAVLGETATRLDFSLNSDPTFPINNAHAFAVFIGIRIAASKLRALWSMPFTDKLLFLRSAFLGVRQQKRSGVRPYQLMRYWSNVPFRHGQDDVVKYGAAPSATNEAHRLGQGRNGLQAELVRHLNEDREMASFDFGVQLLDVERMTHRGSRRDASFWVENATVEWNEKQAPFHTVARLRLIPKSELSPDACEAMHIDVTEHSTTENTPLGSLNRARWVAEAASRKARLAPPPDGVTSMPGTVPQPAWAPMQKTRSQRVLRGVGIAAAAALAAVAIGAIWYARLAGTHIPILEPVNEVRYLDQGWGTTVDSPDRELYYYTPQGAALQGIPLRYSWLVHLEMPLTRARFADPDRLRRFGFIVDPRPTPKNPDQLPVGFAKNWNDKVGNYLLDLTCSTCHTGQLNITTRDGRTTAIRIDGGAAMHAIQDGPAIVKTAPGQFTVTLGAALGATLVNPFKFNRFARAVLGPAYPEGKRQLKADLRDVVRQLAALALAQNRHGLYPVQGGFGRVDALAGITNAVFGDHITPSNYVIGSGPVSLPYVWDIWKFDWVQYNGSVSQPMARNMVETLGTGAIYTLLDPSGRPVPPSDRYRTSTAFDNLVRIESTLQKLKPPQWPEDLLGPIDRAKAERGRSLFEQHCVGCHGPHVASEPFKRDVAPLREASAPVWRISVKTVDDVGTDPNSALNFINNRVDLTPLGLDPAGVRARLKQELDKQQQRRRTLVADLEREVARLKAAGADERTLGETETQLDYARTYPKTDADITKVLDTLVGAYPKVSEGVGLTILGMTVRDRYYAEHNLSDAARACYDGDGAIDLPQEVPGYKPRPLEGVWATPPFLHNGSVPNLYELLSPVEERSGRFYLGRREFAPGKVGYVGDPLPGSGGFWFDTALSGNRNIGHEFRKGYVPYDDNNPVPAKGILGPELTPDERFEIIEYLKVHRDDPNAQPYTPPDCFALLQSRP